MTRLDFSGPVVDEARRLAERAGADIRYVRSTVEDALAVLEPGAFDLAFTGIGALCWLPDIRRWAAVVAGLLKPAGRLLLREGHPMLWALDEQVPDGLVIRYPYLERPEPDVFDEPCT